MGCFFNSWVVGDERRCLDQRDDAELKVLRLFVGRDVLALERSCKRGDMDITTVWTRIEGAEGEVFRQVRGQEFSYEVRSGGVVPSTTNRLLPRSHFEKALERMPLSGPGQLQDLQGPSYLYAILTDSRITGG
jgi:hypothetical protein